MANACSFLPCMVLRRQVRLCFGQIGSPAVLPCLLRCGGSIGGWQDAAWQPGTSPTRPGRALRTRRTFLVCMCVASVWQTQTQHARSGQHDIGRLSSSKSCDQQTQTLHGTACGTGCLSGYAVGSCQLFVLTEVGDRLSVCNVAFPQGSPHDTTGGATMATSLVG